MSFSKGKIFAIPEAPESNEPPASPPVAVPREVDKEPIIVVIIAPIPTTIPAIKGVRKETWDFIEEVISERRSFNRSDTLEIRSRYSAILNKALETTCGPLRADS